MFDLEPKIATDGIFASVAAGAIREVAAEALSAHFSRVSKCFRGRSGRGSPGSALFSGFHVLLWQRRLSEKWPRKPWQRGFLEFSRASVAAEAIREVTAEALAAHFSRISRGSVAAKAL